MDNHDNSNYTSQQIEDNEFLSKWDIEKSYAGGKPDLDVHLNKWSHVPFWYMRRLEKAAFEEGMYFDDFMDKWKLSGDPHDDIDYLPEDPGNWPNDEERK